ncbi:hypothetical protein L3X38_023818 [Prunus dulcis]|uniref:Uncharacterized protein n=1 Tax=Prunus dulcis TaxID=3755 RepID=A0AAD4VZF9_PRUDU|nr:hypothetical protein L3X38_023818 [Prunus dulcis]
MQVGSFKLNVDVAVDLKDGSRGVGILATELYAMKVGMSFAIDASCVPLVLELDCMNDVQLVHKSSSSTDDGGSSSSTDDGESSSSSRLVCVKGLQALEEEE